MIFYRISMLVWLTSLLALPLWAAEETAITVSSIATPPGSPWYATLIASIFPILLGALTWLSGRISMFVATKLREAKTSEQGKWYSMAFVLAGMAVRAAETSFGPDTQTGAEKKAKAKAWLKDRLVAIDPTIVDKTPNLDSLIEGLVNAAYQDAFTALSPLVQPAQPKPGQ